MARASISRRRGLSRSTSGRAMAFTRTRPISSGTPPAWSSWKWVRTSRSRVPFPTDCKQVAAVSPGALVPPQSTRAVVLPEVSTTLCPWPTSRTVTVRSDRRAVWTVSTADRHRVTTQAHTGTMGRLPLTGTKRYRHRIRYTNPAHRAK